MKFIIPSWLLVAQIGIAQAQLQTPAQFLGYELGDRFTLHHRMVAYFRQVDETAANVKVIQYGETYEKRPLILAYVTSPENFPNLEQIRMDNLRRAGVEQGTPSSKIAIVWLSYNVHGNEANSMETSMRTLYELVNPGNARTKEWLKNTVVILDPCINPDGRDRFANFFNQYGNSTPNADPQAREHREPWPGGRTNHYFFDLNRDWAWQTQAESRARIKVYNQWLPHVHVDYHEQGYNSPYYFAPAAEPYHEVITPWQRQFQETIGRNNAKYFDEQGWLYFTKESFDLYYPSYGDTYPTFNGAIGMTYEKGGIGSGLIVTTREGDPLTLKDRIEHHFTTGMATIEVSSQNATRLTDEFEKYFRENVSNPPFPYKTYVIKSGNNPDKIRHLTAWLETHSVQFGYSSVAKQTRGFDYKTQSVSNFNLSTDDIIFNIYQPKGRFITTVFEPQSKLADSATYDITSWNLIYGSGLKAFALNEKVSVGQPFKEDVSSVPETGKAYAFICRYQSLKDVEFLGALAQRGVKVRAAQKPFTLKGQSFDAGTLVITRRNNEDIPDLEKTLKDLAARYDRVLTRASTGFVDRGPDFGSSDVAYLTPPKVALLGGDQTFSNAHGEIWHYFEQQIHYPVTVIGTDYFRTVDLWKYNVFIVPDGNYRLFDDETLATVGRWVGDGGNLVVIGRGTNAFADKKGFGLKQFATEEAKKESEKKDKDSRQKEGAVDYGDADRKELPASIFGAIYKIRLDKTHPLSFGLGDTYYSLKTNSLFYSQLENGWNVGVIKGKAKPVQGFAGYKINQKLDNALLFGVEDKGRGKVIYMADNPLYRCFWEDGKMLFSNAVFMLSR